ncbi:hypothetical protein B0H13DRAFT_2048339 [Mycena leptocephala]|nr:hypothetical protein B0H13DRAFT_2048339 [Mycena leptocephala]
MQLGQFSAVITVDGLPLSEYAVEYSADGTEATCWIASENDKRFCVKLKDTDTSPRRTISGRISVDGIKCGGQHLAARAGHRVATSSRDSVSTSANTRRPLTFGKQVLTDDDAYLNAAISPELGTIKAVCDLVRPRHGRGTTRRNWHRPQETHGIMHERSKKAMGHSVQFGPEFHRQNLPFQKASQTIRTLATFTFKYRPIELLRAEGIAPPAPRAQRAATPTDVVDLSMDVDEDDGDDAEIRKLETRLNALKKKNKGKQVKRESSNIKKEIKSEEPIFRPGEVIDLT